MGSAVRYISGMIAAMFSLLAPIKGLILCAVIFVTIDFITGVVASYKRAKRTKMRWCFESKRAWDTIVKLAFVMAGIVLAWLMDSHILHFMNLRLANLFTGFVCGVEFWSYLENAAEISQHPLFEKLGKVMKDEIEDNIGGKIK